MGNEYKYCSARTSDGYKEWLSPIDNPEAEPICLTENGLEMTFQTEKEEKENEEVRI